MLARRHTKSPEATQSFGAEVAKVLTPGSIVGLFGELGSGKTCFVQGVCRQLEVEGPVTSPSFIMINEYRGHLGGREIPIYHFDLYRLEHPAELYELGCEEYFYADGICLVEWAERSDHLLPKEALRVYLRYINDSEREVLVCNGAEQS